MHIAGFWAFNCVICLLQAVHVGVRLLISMVY